MFCISNIYEALLCVAESSYVVLARAIKDYHSVYDPRALSFHEGDYIKVSY